MRLMGQALVVSLCALAAPAQAATYTLNWHLGHPTLDYFEEAAFSFKKAVEEGTKGDIAVNIVLQSADPAPSAGELPQIAAKTARGEIEMGHSFVDVVGAIEPKFGVFKAPYLFRGYGHLETVFEGPVGAGLLAGLREHGLVGISFTYSGGANGLVTRDRVVRRPEDLKGLRVGVYGDVIDRAWLESLGAVAVPIGHDRGDLIARLLTTGELDGVVTTWRNFEKMAPQPEFAYFNLPESSYLVSVTYINAKLFDSMPAAYRELITSSFREAGRVERAKTIELNENAKSIMLARGVRVAHVSREARKRFESALRPVYAAAIEPHVGAPLVRAIRGVKDSSLPKVPAALAQR